MAHDTRATTPEVVPYRLNVEQFEMMIDADIFPEGHHVELLGGILVDKLAEGRPHGIATGELRDILAKILPPGWYVDARRPIQCGRYDRPEADLVIVRGQRRDYLERPPWPKDLALVVEVSDATYAKDRGSKWRLYAAASIPTYWIIRLADRRIEVYDNPAGRDQDAIYREGRAYLEKDAVPVLIDGREVGRIAVRDVLP